MSVDSPVPTPRPILRIVWWAVGLIGALTLVFAGVLIAPIIFPSATGSSGQGLSVEGYPTTVTAIGDDDRVRSMTVRGDSGQTPALAAVVPGDRLVVTGSGFDSNHGIYVAVCRVPDRLGDKPGPCLGGIPEFDGQESSPGAVQWAPSNWINQEWGWRLFGARSYDSVQEGTFTAYLIVSPPVAEGVDCLADRCGIYTRNDHTALDNRMQDLFVPVQFLK